MKYIMTFESLQDGLKYKRQVEDKGLDFTTLRTLDPSKNYKYLPIICKYALDGVSNDNIRNYIKAFDLLSDKNKIANKDIYSYQNFDSLKNVIDVVDIKSKGEIIGKIRQEREIVLDNEDYLIFIPLSNDASVKYGMGAKWCISMKNDAFFWYTLTKANILFYFVIVKNKNISDKLFKQFNDLDDSMMGDQGNIKDPENFEKFVVMVFGKPTDGKLKHKQIWTKSNHLLKTKYNKEFIEALGFDEDFFKNDLPYKEIDMSELDDDEDY